MQESVASWRAEEYRTHRVVEASFETLRQDRLRRWRRLKVELNICGAPLPKRQKADLAEASGSCKPPFNDANDDEVDYFADDENTDEENL